LNGILNDHVKANYEPKIHGCSTFRSGKILKHGEYIGKQIKKWKFFKNTSTHQTILRFGIPNFHVKTNYEHKNQGYSTFRSGVLLKICFKAFFVHWEVLYKVEIFKHIPYA